jgi:hypothetical protein
MLRCAARCDNIVRGVLARIPVRSTRAGYCNEELKHPPPQTLQHLIPQIDGTPASNHTIAQRQCAAPRASTTLSAGSSRVFWYDRNFHSMIFGGEIIKIRHGVGCVRWPFSEVSEVVMCFFFALASNLSPRAKYPSRSMVVTPIKRISWQRLVRICGQKFT